MAILQQESNAKQFFLYPGFLVGRSRSSSLQLTNGLVSARHADFRWTGAMWELKDLGTRNGTFVDGERLPVGEYRPIYADAVLLFGDRQQMFTLVCDAAPDPMAQVDNGPFICGEDGVLALPDSDHPAIVIRQVSERSWVREDGKKSQKRVTTDDIVEYAGASYRLILPIGESITMAADSAQYRTDDVMWLITANPSGAFVSLSILFPDGQRRELPHRAFGEMLLYLAEARLRDQDSAEPPHERGWCNVARLRRELDIDENQMLLNLWVHRARSQAKQAGIIDGENLIQRRSNGKCRQIRLGAARFELIGGS